MTNDTPPTYRVYSVIPRENKDDYWLNIGVAFPHQDGKGFNVMLQALPIAQEGQVKLVLREAAEDDKEGRQPAKPDRQETTRQVRERPSRRGPYPERRG